MSVKLANELARLKVTPKNREEMLKHCPQPKYTRHGRTKQSQKDETDINKLLDRAGREQTLSHLEKYQGNYGDFTGYDFEKHINTIAEGQSIFEALPAEVKREFEQSPKKFFAFVTNPDNAERLPEVLPQLADRGTQLPQINQVQQSVAPGTDATPSEVTPTSETSSAPAEPQLDGLDPPTG